MNIILYYIIYQHLLVIHNQYKLYIMNITILYFHQNLLIVYNQYKIVSLL